MVLADFFILFAQQGRFGANNPPPKPASPEEALIGTAVCIGFSLFIMLLTLIFQYFFARMLSRALSVCAEENRTMEPGTVWWILFPGVGAIFAILALFKVPESLQNEYRARGMVPNGDCGKQNALITLLTNLFCLGVVGIIFFFLFWSQVSSCASELEEAPRRRIRRKPREDYNEALDDDEDDRPRRRRRDVDADDDE